MEDVKIVDIPSTKNLGKFGKYFRAALEMPDGKAVLIEEPGMGSVAGSFNSAIKHHGLAGKLKVMQRQGNLYIIRKEA